MHRQERFERADPLVPRAAMRRETSHGQLERQRAAVSRDDRPTRRLGDDAVISDVTSLQRCERAEPTVLFADDTVHRDRTGWRNTRAQDRLNRDDVRNDTGFHVARTTSVQHAVGNPRRERIAIHPLRQVTSRDDVDVPLQYESRRARLPQA